MGTMMGFSGGWMVLLWVLLALILAAGGTIAARVLATGRSAEPSQVSGGSPAVAQARDALRLRYANGEISREEYLQGKVELED